MIAARADQNAPSAPLLEVAGLCVSRGVRRLVDGLDVSVGANQVLELRGANGVGKSTLLLALAGIVRPEAGSVRFAGGGPEVDPRERMQLISYQHGLKPRLSVVENLRFWQALHGASGSAIELALEAVGLGGLGALQTGYLSSGQVRRLSLARLLVSERPIWLLDEPTAALDAEGEALVGRLIDAHRQKPDAVIVVATHHALQLADPTGLVTVTLGKGA
ncbi:heme ABC exporter ATP-binding protein CcmA [Devosia sp.]|uniref:heme ABC exporter ATP-binding protein CcmA n=1 Tax=Devosia sp. TaxID=1871048 RepID=UPI003A8E604D